MTYRIGSSLAALALVTMISACSTSVPLNQAPVETGQAMPTDGAGGAAGASTGGTPQSKVSTVDLASSAASAAPSGRTVYFDFDSYVIKDEDKALIEGHAKALVANRAKRLTLEGHTDERGGREYNLALGQKRADAVAKTLTLLGAADNQVEAVSFGKERPAVQGSDEAAWAKNRRVELKDR